MGDTSNFSLDGRVAVVTGGSTGIGHGIALALARAGADVAIAARTGETLDAARKEIEGLGRRSVAVPADVTRAGDVQRLVDRTLEAFGRVDILVNNAGATFSSTFKRGPLMDLTEQDIDGCMALNFKSMVLCAQAVVPHMRARGNGAIINISSIAGREMEHPTIGFAIYGAAKAAIISVTRSMAVEWAPEVRVNCVAPGVIDTPRVTANRNPERMRSQLAGIAMGRIGMPQDVAGAVVYLASDAAAWVTGSIIDVHGGLRSTQVPPSRTGGAT